MELIVPLIVALSGLPALAIAVWIGRRDDSRSRGLALHWTLLALAMLLGATGLYWAGELRGRFYTVVGALVIAIHALALSMLCHLQRHRPRPLP